MRLFFWLLSCKVVLSLDKVCMSTNGTACVFPFGYNGMRYDHCAKVFSRGLKKSKPWCLIKGGWGYCSDSEECNAINSEACSNCPVESEASLNSIKDNDGLGKNSEFLGVIQIGAAAEVEDESECCGQCPSCCGQKMYTYDVKKKTCACYKTEKGTTTKVIKTTKRIYSNVCKEKQSGGDDVVTVTAKFWYVSDYATNAEQDADNYVKYINQVLTNTKVPINYKRWGSVQKLPKTNEQVAMQDSRYNYRFVHALGTRLEDHKKLKQSADHIILLVNETKDKSAKCVQFDGWRQFGSEIYATAVVPKYHVGNPEQTFAHEVGHCMGAMHNRETMSDGGKKDEYNYGYCLPNTDYATIMSYNHECKPKASITIPHYSNPDVKYKGNPTGTENNNNARAITEMRKATSRLGDNCKDGALDADSDDYTKDVCTWSAPYWTEWSKCCCKKYYRPTGLAMPGDNCWFSNDKNEEKTYSFHKYKTFRTKREALKNPLGDVIETRRVDLEIKDCAADCGCHYKDEYINWCKWNKSKKFCEKYESDCERSCKC